MDGFLETPRTLQYYRIKGFKRGPASIILRDVSLSDSYEPDRCCFSRREPCTLSWEKLRIQTDDIQITYNFGRYFLYVACKNIL